MRRTVTLVVLAGALLAAAAAPAQQQPDRVRLAIARDDGTLTPYTFRNAYPLVMLVYDTLTWRDAGGVPQPWLARSIRRSDDGLTVTVDLRAGAAWHDGRPLTARDVAFTYGFVARREHPRFTPQLRDIAGVQARDRDTVVFRLRRPSLGLLDQPFADVPILPRHLWAGLPDDALAPAGPPVGSGPYRLTEHVAGRRYGFQAVRDYHRGRPTVERVDVRIEPRADAVVGALEAGGLDMAELSPDPRALGSATVRTVSGDDYAGSALLFNLASAPFDRRAARRAVIDALDLERIARAATGTASADVAHPALRGYLHPASPWASRTPLHRPDPGRARIAFAEQGIGEFEVLASGADPVGLAAARQLVVAVERAGGRARLQETTPTGLARATGQDGAEPDFQAAVVATPALASHDPSFLATLFRSDSDLNFGSYRSAAFDRLAAALAAAPTGARRRAAAQRMLERIARDAPATALLYPDVGFAYRSAAHDGWEFVRGEGILDKRSFVGSAPAQRRPAAGAAEDPIDRAQSDPSLLPVVIGLGALLALGLAVAALRRRRRA